MTLPFLTKFKKKKILTEILWKQTLAISAVLGMVRYTLIKKKKKFKIPLARSTPLNRGSCRRKKKKPRKHFCIFFFLYNIYFLATAVQCD